MAQEHSRIHSGQEMGECPQVKEALVGAEGAIHLVAMDYIGGYAVRPGFYDIYGATAIPGGVNFTIHSHHATGVELLLFRRTEDKPYAVLPFPSHYRIGNVYSMIVFKLDIGEFEYAYRVEGPYEPEKGLIFNKDKYLLDPYAKAVTGQSLWGQPSTLGQRYKARVVKDDFDWGDNQQPLLPMQDLIIYELHVRGYTKHGSSAVKFPGTFEGLNAHGIEVYLDVVFNHTAEGNENGPFFSFKGFDNNIYYMLTPEGFYYNFSGCGNTLNCNHPIVQQLIVSCLRYWVTAYRVDGFRFDLASILGRNEDGSPMEKPPLLQQLAFDPILGDVKLIAEAWDAGGLYQVGKFPSWNRWAEWNGRYRDDIRRYLKGDEGTAGAAALRIAGSSDIYDPSVRDNASVNFITCHDGFTLYDLYSYNVKHNESNGWNNTDGSNDNHSWNCGAEGETEDKAVNTLRRRMIRNACAVLMCSRGIPMFLAGDEFGNTQFGNNNPYCHDDEVSWLDWGLLEKNQDIFRFFKSMIHFRKEHPVLRSNVSNGFGGLPDISFHGTRPWAMGFSGSDRYIGVMMAGQEEGKQPEAVYIASNAYWEQLEAVLPKLPDGMEWFRAVNTWDAQVSESGPVGSGFTIPPRTVMVFCGR